MTTPIVFDLTAQGPLRRRIDMSELPLVERRKKLRVAYDRREIYSCDAAAATELEKVYAAYARTSHPSHPTHTERVAYLEMLASADLEIEAICRAHKIDDETVYRIRQLPPLPYEVVDGQRIYVVTHQVEPWPMSMWLYL